MKKYLPALWMTLLVVLSVSLGCTKTVKVYVPPNFDLSSYERVGIIDFTSNKDREIDRYVTEQFQNRIHASQSGVRILELGTLEDVLAEIGADRLDLQAIRKIGERYKVQAVFHGDIEYSDVRTNVNMSDLINLNGGVGTYIEATLSARLKETDTGATAWSDSVSFKRSLAKLNVYKGQDLSFGMDGYHDAHKKLVPDMAHAVTEDFRGRYVNQRVE